tara:strand:- start:309 stop:422 length:114 start_codon:yes stop_codon:yes gene_type:complete
MGNQLWRLKENTAWAEKRGEVMIEEELQASGRCSLSL